MLVHERTAAFGSLARIPRQPKGQPRRLALCSYGGLTGGFEPLGWLAKDFGFTVPISVSLTPVAVSSAAFPKWLIDRGGCDRSLERRWNVAGTSLERRWNVAFRPLQQCGWGSHRRSHRGECGRNAAPLRLATSRCGVTCRLPARFRVRASLRTAARLRDCLCPSAIAGPELRWAEIVIAPYQRSRGRRESRGRTGAEQRPLGSGPGWAQERQTSDAYEAEPMLPTALQYGPFEDRVIRRQLSPRQPHCRELAADHIWQLGQLDLHRADVGWSQATTVGYGSAHGAAPAHRRSEG
jgi:hypothetical protein